MDTRDQALSNLTRLHDQFHPHPSPTSKPIEELLTPGGEHHGIVDREGLVMTTTIPLLQSPKRTPDQPSRGRTGGGGGSISWNAMKTSLWFFSLKMWFYRTGIRVGGASWAPQAIMAWPGGGPCWLVAHRWPPSGSFSLHNSLYIPEIIHKMFRPIPRTFISAQK